MFANFPQSYGAWSVATSLESRVSFSRSSHSFGCSGDHGFGSSHFVIKIFTKMKSEDQGLKHQGVVNGISMIPRVEY